MSCVLFQRLIQESRLFFQKADYDQFKKEIRQTVKHLEQGRRVSDAWHTTLGVTHLLAEERKARANIRTAAWDAVLNEQDVQQQLGRRDSILLADLYRDVAASSGEAAIWKAQRQAQEVAQLYSSRTMDDIEIMEPSYRLENEAIARRRSSSCSNMDFIKLLASLDMHSSSLSESSIDASAFTEW